MSAEVGLTEAEREALSTVLPVSEWDYDPDRFKVEVEAVVAHIVTDRVADAIAHERARLRDLTSRLGFGDDISQPMADNDTIVEWVEALGRDANEWGESQAWRIDCALAGHPDDEDCFEHDPMFAVERAIAQERAAWLTKIEALANEPGSGFPYVQVADLRALLPSDATAACVCVCHSGGVGTGCRQSRCEVCPPATAALNTVQAKAEERVHDHPPYRPVCNERLVEGQLRGACLNDDGSEAGR